MITFSTTVTKKTAPPASTPPQKPVKATVTAKAHSPAPPPKIPQKPILPPKAPVPTQKAVGTKKSIDAKAFFRFSPMQEIVLRSDPPKDEAAPAIPTMQMRTYAALKTAQMQHEQILSRITKR